MLCLELITRTANDSDIICMGHIFTFRLIFFCTVFTRTSYNMAALFHSYNLTARSYCNLNLSNNLTFGLEIFQCYSLHEITVLCSSLCQQGGDLQCYVSSTVTCDNRVISRAPGLKLVVQTLLHSLRPIGNIVLICCMFFVVFGILGVQVEHAFVGVTSSVLINFFSPLHGMR